MIGGLIWLAILAGAAVAWRGRAPARPRRSTPYRYHGMLLLVGIPGSGKTYKMLHLMVQRLAEGRHVRVNFNVRHDRLYVALRLRHRLSHAEALAALGRVSHLDTFEDYVDAYDCDLFIDEAQDVLSSTDWQSFPHEVVQFFAQHRHRLCRIVLASHRFGSIHNYVRELVADIQLARPAPWYLKPWYYLSRGRTDLPLLHYVTIKDAEDEATAAGKAKIERRGFALMGSMSLVALDPIVATAYDTHGGVRPSPMAAVRKARRKDGVDVTLKPRREHLAVSLPALADRLPFLSHAERLDCLRTGTPPHDMLQLRWPRGEHDFDPIGTPA